MTIENDIAALRDLIAFAKEELRIDLDSYGIEGGGIDEVDPEERDRIAGTMEMIEKAEHAVDRLAEALGAGLGDPPDEERKP